MLDIPNIYIAQQLLYVTFSLICERFFPTQYLRTMDHNCFIFAFACNNLCTIDVVQVMISVNDHQIMAQWVENKGLS